MCTQIPPKSSFCCQHRTVLKFYRDDCWAKPNRGRAELLINQSKTQFIKKAYCEGKRIHLKGSQITEKSSYESNVLWSWRYMENERGKRRRAAWVDLPKSHTSFEWVDLQQSYPTCRFCLRSIVRWRCETTDKTEKKRTQNFELKQEGLRSSKIRRIHHLRDPADYAWKAKCWWDGHNMRRQSERSTKRTLAGSWGTPSWKTSNQVGRYVRHKAYLLALQLGTNQAACQHHRVPIAATSCMTMAGQRNGYKRKCGPRDEWKWAT